MVQDKAILNNSVDETATRCQEALNRLGGSRVRSCICDLDVEPWICNRPFEILGSHICTVNTSKGSLSMEQGLDPGDSETGVWHAAFSPQNTNARERLTRV